jgi:hypothetical protein
LCGPPDGDETIDIGLALARRQVLLFPLDPREHGPAGPMIARLLLADLARALAERSGAHADCVVWINGCEVLGESRIEPTIAFGADAGVTAIVGTAEGAAAAALQGQVNVVAACGPPPPGLSGELNVIGASDRRPPGLDCGFNVVSSGLQPAGLSGSAGPPGNDRTTFRAEQGAVREGLLCREVGLDEGRAGAISVLVRRPNPRLLRGRRVAR